MLSKNQHGGQLIMNDDIATIEGKKKKTLWSSLIFQEGTRQLVSSGYKRQN